MREVTVKAGKPTKVLKLMIRNMREHVVVEVETADGSEPRGTVETSHGSYILGRKATMLPLAALNTFDKPWNHHNYEISVTSETDAVVRFRTRHIRDVHVYSAVAVVTAVALLIFFVGIGR